MPYVLRNCLDITTEDLDVEKRLPARVVKRTPVPTVRILFVQTNGFGCCDMISSGVAPQYTAGNDFCGSLTININLPDMSSACQKLKVGHSLVRKGTY